MDGLGRKRHGRRHDHHSVTADPRFVDFERRDFRLRPDSPAYALGFEDIDYAAIGQGYLGSIAWRTGGKPFCVDKLPSNFLNLPFIFAALPEARVLHMVRDPVETCFSNLRELFSDACPYSYDQQELAIYCRMYLRLMEHFQERFAGRFLDVSYDSLVGDTGNTLRRVTAHCGIAFDPVMLDPASRAKGVATASAVQVRGAVAPRGTARWKPYAVQLQPMLEGIARQDAAWG